MCEIDRYTKVNKWSITIEYIFFIQLMYNNNDHLAKQSIFVRCLMSSLTSTNPFPPRPKTPFTFVVYVYSDMSLSKGHLGSRGGGGGESI